MKFKYTIFMWIILSHFTCLDSFLLQGVIPL